MYPGGDLLSHPVAQAVSSALEGLTSVFEMGTGVSPPPWPPETYFSEFDALLSGWPNKNKIPQLGELLLAHNSLGDEIVQLLVRTVLNQPRGHSTRHPRQAI